MSGSKSAARGPLDSETCLDARREFAQKRFIIGKSFPPRYAFGYWHIERRFRAHFDFNEVDSKLESAGIDSRQFEELMISSPGGRDSPKLRIASARAGGT